MKLPDRTPEGASGQSQPPDIHVLVVDKDEVARTGLMALVRMFGVTVSGAASGDEAYGMALEHRPDLVLCVDMPALDGFEFARRLRRDPSGRRILVVAVGEHRNNLDLPPARDARFDARVFKPVTADAVARLLDRAVDVRDAEDRRTGGLTAG
jgi:CheY-like chemotaxis protein